MQDFVHQQQQFVVSSFVYTNTTATQARNHHSMQVCEGCTSLRLEQSFPSLRSHVMPAWDLFNPEFSWFHSFQIKKSRTHIKLRWWIMLQKGHPIYLSLANQWQPHHVSAFTSLVAMCSSIPQKLLSHQLIPDELWGLCSTTGSVLGESLLLDLGRLRMAHSNDDMRLTNDMQLGAWHGRAMKELK